MPSDPDSGGYDYPASYLRRSRLRKKPNANIFHETRVRGESTLGRYGDTVYDDEDHHVSHNVVQERNG
jgi:hypothetical protein